MEDRDEGEGFLEETLGVEGQEEEEVVVTHQEKASNEGEMEVAHYDQVLQAKLSTVVKIMTIQCTIVVVFVVFVSTSVLITYNNSL